MNKAIVDKYNIDVDSIKTYDDLTEVFQLVHDDEPDFKYCCFCDSRIFTNAV